MAKRIAGAGESERGKIWGGRGVPDASKCEEREGEGQSNLFGQGAIFQRWVGG